jgi:hypothetical protein
LSQVVPTPCPTTLSAIKVQGSLGSLLSRIFTQPSRMKNQESLVFGGTCQQDETLGVPQAWRLKHKKFVTLVGSYGSSGGFQCIACGHFDIGSSLLLARPANGGGREPAPPHKNYVLSQTQPFFITSPTPPLTQVLCEPNTTINSHTSHADPFNRSNRSKLVRCYSDHAV